MTDPLRERRRIAGTNFSAKGETLAGLEPSNNCDIVMGIYFSDGNRIV